MTEQQAQDMVNLLREIRAVLGNIEKNTGISAGK